MSERVSQKLRLQDRHISRLENKLKKYNTLCGRLFTRIIRGTNKLDRSTLGAIRRLRQLIDG